MIPFFDYRRELSELRGEIDDAIAGVLEGGQLILGPAVRSFEAEFAEFAGASAAVGVNSGTDALILALRAVGVRPGDEVLTVSNSGVPPIAAIRAVGASPRFVDVDPLTLTLDPAGLPGALTERCRAVMPVHLYGRVADMPSIMSFAREHGLRVIEDCAQSHGSVLEGRHSGRFGDAGCFSFYPTKNVGAYGDGGLVVTDDAELAEEVRRQRMYGFDTRRHAAVEGLNSRLDELQAAILRVKLAHYPAQLQRRRDVAARYIAGLEGIEALTPPSPTVDSAAHSWHLFACRHLERDGVRARLRELGVGTGIHYDEAVHRMPAYRGQPWADAPQPVSEAACGSTFSLPMFPGITDDEVSAVIRAVRTAATEA